MEIVIIAAVALLFLSRGQTQVGPNGYGARDPDPPPSVGGWTPTVGPGSITAADNAAAGMFDAHPSTPGPLGIGGWKPNTGAKPPTIATGGGLRATPPPPLGFVPARPANLSQPAFTDASTWHKPNIVLR